MPDNAGTTGCTCDPLSMDDACPVHGTFTEPRHKPPPSLAPSFTVLYPRLAEIAWAHGYALAVHGSLTRDLDLVACPWVEEASAAEVVAEALRAWLSGYVQESGPLSSPECRAHGRLAWSISFGAGHATYVDLSIMPRAEPERLIQEEENDA